VASVPAPGEYLLPPRRGLSPRPVRCPWCRPLQGPSGPRERRGRLPLAGQERPRGSIGSGLWVWESFWPGREKETKMRAVGGTRCRRGPHASRAVFGAHRDTRRGRLRPVTGVSGPRWSSLGGCFSTPLRHTRPRRPLTWSGTRPLPRATPQRGSSSTGLVAHPPSGRPPQSPVVLDLVQVSKANPYRRPKEHGSIRPTQDVRPRGRLELADKFRHCRRSLTTSQRSGAVRPLGVL